MNNELDMSGIDNVFYPQDGDITIERGANRKLTYQLRELCVEKCRTCRDYNLCCEIGRCGDCNKGCYKSV